MRVSDHLSDKMIQLSTFNIHTDSTVVHIFMQLIDPFMLITSMLIRFCISIDPLLMLHPGVYVQGYEGLFPD